MKKLALLGIVFSFISAIAFAQEPTPVAEVETLKGDIIDNMCVGAQKTEALAEFVKTHMKQCALSPDCQAAGYSVLADGKLIKLDKESTIKVVEFLTKEDSKLQVVVTGKKTGEELKVASIENQ